MPSHAIPSGPDGRAHRSAARRRRIKKAWQSWPYMLLIFVAVTVAGQLEPARGGVASQILDSVLAGLLAGLLIAVSVVAAPALKAHREKTRASRRDPS
jgi:hypothetical protein